MPGASTSVDQPLAADVAFFGAKGSEYLVVRLRDGRVVASPLSLYPILEAAAPADRATWRLIGAGQGIHWSTLDLDLSTAGIVHGHPDRTLTGRPSLSAADLERLLAAAAGSGGASMSIDEIAARLGAAFSKERLAELFETLKRMGAIEPGPDSERRAG